MDIYLPIYGAGQGFSTSLWFSPLRGKSLVPTRHLCRLLLPLEFKKCWWNAFRYNYNLFQRPFPLDSNSRDFFSQHFFFGVVTFLWPNSCEQLYLGCKTSKVETAVALSKRKSWFLEKSWRWKEPTTMSRSLAARDTKCQGLEETGLDNCSKNQGSRVCTPC